MTLQWRVCFSTITPESVEQGDVEESGVEKEETGDLRDLLLDCHNYGISPRTSGDRTLWLSSGYEIEDYRTGEEKEYTLHLKGKHERDEKTYARIENLLRAGY